jgi:hypothetical protein
MTSPSFDRRESMTLFSRSRQKGHFTGGQIPARSV